MSDLAAFDPPPSPPPPSYEISQFEFDQKTSHILEQSTHDPPQRLVDDDGFEVWDEAVFEAALNGMSTLSVAHQSSSSDRRASSSSAVPPPAFSPPPGSSRNSSYPPEKQRPRPLPSGSPAPAASSSSSGSGSSSGSATGSSYVGSSSSSSVPSSPPQEVRPLRVQKKTRPQKERPAWYAEAGLGGGSPPPSPIGPQPRPQPQLQLPAGSSSSHTVQPTLRRGLTVFNRAEEDRESTPPPEFSPVGPSLDGPPYETIVMTYEGNSASPGPAPAPSPGPPAFSEEPVTTRTPEPPAFSVEPPAPRSPEPPAFASPHHAVQPAAPAPNQTSQSRPDPHAEAAHRHPAHSQSLPQRPVSSTASRPHAAHHQSMPASSSIYDKVKSRPMSFYPPGQPDVPRVPFNPQVAYAKPSMPALPTGGQDAESHNAANPSSFYSHAVSAHYSFNVPARMRKQPLPPPLPEQPQQQYPAMGMTAPVASPRPNYGYSQATFSDTASIYGQSSTAATNTTTINNWGYSGQQGWPPAGGGYQNYR